MQPTIAVIGATGKAGKYLVKHLLLRGFPLKLLLRNPDKYPINDPAIGIIKGDVQNYEDILALIKDCQAVVSALGQSPGSPPLFSQTSAQIIRAMEECRIKRYIALTGLSIDVPGDRKGVRTSQASAYMRQVYPATIGDKQQEYAVLAKSSIDWTLVRVPLIEQTDLSGNTCVSLEDCPGEKISSTDLAFFLIDQLTDTQHVKQAPFIATHQ